MVDIQPSPEIEAVVRRWLSTSAARESNTPGDLFSTSSALTYVGSAADEIWTDDVLRSAFAALPRDLKPFRYEDLFVTAYECEAFGWAFWTATLVMPDTDTRTEFRGTVILVIERSVWRIVHSHNSTPVSNLQSMGPDAPGTDVLMEALAAAMPEFSQTGMVSVMFTDIADSTPLAETLGDRAWSALVKRHVGLVGDALRSFGGTLVKSLGDGTMSTFPTARASLSAARAVQSAVDEEETEPRLRIRVGIHTGEVVSDDGDCFGSVVNKAARIAGAARPGEIRVSEATRIMVGGARDFDFTDGAEVALKGLEGTHLIHRLEWQT